MPFRPAPGREQQVIQRFTREEEKFAGGNKAAGVRARKVLMEIKQIAADGRKEMNPSSQVLAELAGMSNQSLLDALDRVGLKLEKARRPLEVLNVDDAKKTPTQN